MTFRPDDAGHPPAGDHAGESPHFDVTRGPESISVELQAWGPRPPDLYRTLIAKQNATWGDEPYELTDASQGLTASEAEQLEAVFNGTSLPQITELITFSFKMDGITRAATHQIVRTRIGAGFNQHGGRNNDWRHRNWTMPETIHRLIEHYDRRLDDPFGAEINQLGDRLESCHTDTQPIMDLIENEGETLDEYIIDYLKRGKELYAALVDSGIPRQDARRLLPIGTQTYLFAHYNWPALSSWLANRLEFNMDWEINCVAQLVLRELWIHLPAFMVLHLGSHSDRAKQERFAGLDMSPPVGKWPIPADMKGRQYSQTAAQNPFWVLTPEAQRGGPIEWVKTNGVWPNKLSHWA